MSLDLSRLTSAPVPMTVGGATYNLSPLTLADLGELESFVAGQLTDPIKLAKELAEGQPPEVASRLLTMAYQEARRGARSLSSPEAGEVLSTPRGLVEIFRLTLRRNHPELAADPEKVLALIHKVNDDQRAVLDRVAFGGGGDDEESPDPKEPDADPTNGGASFTTSRPASVGPPPS